MGTLTLPKSGAIYSDTAPIIYSLEKHTDYENLLQPLWQAMDDEEIEVVTSSLTLLETLVAPLKNNDNDLADDYQTFLTKTKLNLSPITNEILLEAAKLRAALNLKTPDAIHAATALKTNCVQFITNDSGFRRVSALNVVTLKDLI